ncbi:ribonuclease III [bacterium]|nr:ribonuclease III [bacterium]
MNYNLKHYAYVGDCVWELFIRELVIKKTQKQDVMHKMSTKYVNAQAQANILELVLEKLSDDELDIQKRGRNLKITINKKSNPKIHTLATSFEVLIGYLYLNNKNRLNELLDYIKTQLEELK